MCQLRSITTNIRLSGQVEPAGLSVLQIKELRLGRGSDNGTGGRVRTQTEVLDSKPNTRWCWGALDPIYSFPECVWQGFVWWTACHSNSIHSPAKVKQFSKIKFKKPTLPHIQSAIGHASDSFNGSNIPGTMRSFPLIGPQSPPPSSRRATRMPGFPGPSQERHSSHQILPTSRESRTSNQQEHVYWIPDNDKMNHKKIKTDKVRARILGVSEGTPSGGSSVSNGEECPCLCGEAVTSGWHYAGLIKWSGNGNDCAPVVSAFPLWRLWAPLSHVQRRRAIFLSFCSASFLPAPQPLTPDITLPGPQPDFTEVWADNASGE